MRLTPPRVITFWIAVLLVLLGVVGFFVPLLEVYTPVLILAGFILLMLANLFKKL